MLGGVAAGLSAWTGVDVTIVRLAFVLTALLSGFGLVVYVVGWLVLPAGDAPRPIAPAALADRRGIAYAAALCSALLVVLFTASALGVHWLGALAVPIVISAGGLVLIARNSTPEEQAGLRVIAGAVFGTGRRRGRWVRVIRVVAAVILLISGLATVLHGRESVALLRPLSGLVLILAAVLVLLGPWWLRIARDLVLERQARARAEERADIAARVHDSVLQTLALIQLHSDDPHRVIQLARAQERELRAWLFDGRAPGTIPDDALTVAAGVRLIQQDVEAAHGVTVEAITVGDCPLDDGLAALLAAAREATVNAAKWSGCPAVSVFAEVEATTVSVFVRDRGAGFDPEAVPGDRKGVAESIRGRVTRRGGTAIVRSTLGEGTEVSLAMPRAARDREQSRS